MAFLIMPLGVVVTALVMTCHGVSVPRSHVVIGSNGEEFYRATCIAQQMVLNHWHIKAEIKDTLNGAPYGELKDGTVDFTTGFWFGNSNYMTHDGYNCGGLTYESLVGVGVSYRKAGLTYSLPEYMDPSISSLANFSANPSLSKSFKGPLITFGPGTALDLNTKKVLKHYKIDQENPNLTVIALGPAEFADYINDHYTKRDHFFIVGTFPRNFNEVKWPVRTLDDPDNQLGGLGQFGVMWASRTSNIMKTLPAAAAQAMQRIHISVPIHAYLQPLWMNLGNETSAHGNNHTKCEEVVKDWLQNNVTGRRLWNEWINDAPIHPNPTDMSFDEFRVEYNLPPDPRRGELCPPQEHSYVV